MSAKSILLKMISRNGLILALFATVCVGLITTTYFVTRDTIASEMKAALARTLNQLVDKSLYNNDVYHDCTIIEDAGLLGSDKPLQAYRMRMNGNPIAVIFETIAPNGYSGQIKMVVGVYTNGTIAGVRVTEHKETPGLGDKIELSKDNWINHFSNKSLSNPAIDNWAVKKDGGEFDSFTGATITPRAVVSQVANTLEFYDANSNWLFSATNNCNQQVSK